jgi:hypothetical protein
LVFMMMVAQSAIREDREVVDPEETMTLGELRAALAAFRRIEAVNAPLRSAADPDSQLAPAPVGVSDTDTSLDQDARA